MARKSSLKIVPPPGAAPKTAWLRPATAEWVAEVERLYRLDGHHRHLLHLAAAALDRAALAREVLDREGATFFDRFRQPKPRPEVAIEQSSTNTYRLLVRELGLDLPRPGDEQGRPPRIGG